MKKTLGLLICSLIVATVSYAINIEALDAISRRPIKNAAVTIHSTSLTNPLEFVRQTKTDNKGKVEVILPEGEQRYWLKIYKSGYDIGKATITGNSPLSLSLLHRPLRSPTSKMFSRGKIKVTAKVFEYNSLEDFQNKNGRPVAAADFLANIFRIGNKLVGIGASFDEKPFAQTAYGYNRKTDNKGVVTLHLPAQAEINFAAIKPGYLPYTSSLKTGTVTSGDKIIDLALIKIGE